MNPKTNLRFFITHSWLDNAFAQKFCDDLRAHGFDGFLDVYSIHLGDNIPREINRGLEDCDVYIPILSFDAIKSKWCEHEISAAMILSKEPERNGRPLIIPVLAEDCRSALPPLLKPLRYVNFAHRYDAALQELLVGFGLLAGESESLPSTVPSVPPEPLFQKESNRYIPIIAVVAAIVVLMTLSTAVAWWWSNNTLPAPTTFIALATDTTVLTTAQFTAVPTQPLVTLSPTILSTLSITSTVTRTRTATTIQRTPTPLVPTKQPTPLASPTPAMRTVQLQGTLLLFQDPGQIGDYHLAFGSLDNGRFIRIAEGNLDQNSLARKIKIEIAVGPLDFNDGVIINNVAQANLYSSVTTDDVGRIKSNIAVPAILVGTRNYRPIVIFECWVSEQTLRQVSQ